MSFDHGFYRPTVEENNKRVFRTLGCDVLKFTPNWHVVRKLMLEALKRKGDFCWHCHTGIFSYPMHVAIKYGIPLVIWGEPSAEYTSYYGYDDEESVDEERFNRFVNLGITAQDMQGMLDGTVTEKDLLPFTYPAERRFAKAEIPFLLSGKLYSVGYQKTIGYHHERTGMAGGRSGRCAAGIQL